MAEISRRRAPPWLPWLIAVAVLVGAGLIWVGWQSAHRAALDTDIAVPGPAVPDILPDAPRLPDAPIPTPK